MVGNRAREFVTKDSSTDDPKITETVTTRGSATTRETFDYSLDAFNNRTQACVYDGASQTALRCVATTYVTSSSYTTLNVHLRGLPLTELTTGYWGGSVHTDAQRQWTYDVYSGDSGALADRANLSGHDAARGAGYTIRGNVTSVSRWKSGSTWVTGYYGYDIAGNVTKFVGPNVSTERRKCEAGDGGLLHDAYDGGSPPDGPTYAFPTRVVDPKGTRPAPGISTRSER